MSSVRIITRLPPHALGNRLICLELLLLSRIIIVLQVQELGAEQTDAAAVIDLYGVDILGRADVAVDADGLAVLGHVGLTLQGLQQALQALLLLTLLQQAVAGVVIGVDDQCAGAAVGDGLAALVLRLEGVAMPTMAGCPWCEPGWRCGWSRNRLP